MARRRRSAPRYAPTARANPRGVEDDGMPSMGTVAITAVVGLVGLIGFGLLTDKLFMPGRPGGGR